MQTRADLITELDTLLADNTTKDITPAKVRTVISDLIDSAPNILDDGAKAWPLPDVSRTIYVDKTGDDSAAGAGTIQNPFLTVTAAIAYLNTLTPSVPTVIYVGIGSWADVFTIPGETWIVGVSRFQTLFTSGISANLEYGTTSGIMQCGISSGSQAIQTVLDGGSASKFYVLDCRVAGGIAGPGVICFYSELNCASPDTTRKIAINCTGNGLWIDVYGGGCIVDHYGCNFNPAVPIGAHVTPSTINIYGGSYSGFILRQGLLTINCTQGAFRTLPTASGGTLTLNIIPDLYKPATPADWTAPAPTNVAAALDRLAAVAATPAVMLLKAKNIPVRTVAGAADIGVFDLPPDITRYVILGSSNGGPASPRTGLMVVESLAGTLAGATFNYFPFAGGVGGAMLNPAMTGPTVLLGVDGERAAAVPAVALTAPQLFIRQLTPSANAGAISFYLLILPLP
jgi:hypothetical protein